MNLFFDLTSSRIRQPLPIAMRKNGRMILVTMNMTLRITRTRLLAKQTMSLLFSIESPSIRYRVCLLYDSTLLNMGDSMFMTRTMSNMTTNAIRMVFLSRSTLYLFGYLTNMRRSQVMSTLVHDVSVIDILTRNGISLQLRFEQMKMLESMDRVKQARNSNTSAMLLSTPRSFNNNSIRNKKKILGKRDYKQSVHYNIVVAHVGIVESFPKEDGYHKHVEDESDRYDRDAAVEQDRLAHLLNMISVSIICRIIVQQYQLRRIANKCCIEMHLNASIVGFERIKFTRFYHFFFVFYISYPLLFFRSSYQS